MEAIFSLIVNTNYKIYLLQYFDESISFHFLEPNLIFCFLTSIYHLAPRHDTYFIKPSTPSVQSDLYSLSFIKTIILILQGYLVWFVYGCSEVLKGLIYETMCFLLCCASDVYVKKNFQTMILMLHFSLKGVCYN